MKNNTMKGLTLALLMMMAAFAGCLGGDDADDHEDHVHLDTNDGGYEYASDVDNHRMLMADVCDIKTLAEAHDWAGVKEIYMNGKHAEKSDGSFRTLEGIANAEGKKHGLDTYYGTAVPLHDYLMAAIDGTGMFADASDAMREQAVEKGVQNQIMIAYAVHELNSALAKGAAGNWDVDSGAPHAWDEGWAFYHGPDDADFDYDGCSPYKTGDKRAGNFGTAGADGTANANAAILQAMNNGLDALIAEDLENATMWTNDVVKNLVIIYSQATIRYASKMSTDETVDAAQTHQAEGYSFWRVIEALVYNAYNASSCYNTADWSSSNDDAASCGAYSYMTDYDMGDGQDICYNMVSHSVSGDNSTDCDSYTYVENYTMSDGSDICYNMETHSVSGDNQSVCESYAWYDNASWGNTTYTGCYNMESHQTTNDSQAVCEAYGYYENYGATVTDICYNTATHWMNDTMSQAECEAYSYYVNYGATIFTGCYNGVTHAAMADMAQATCEAYTFGHHGTAMINHIYDFSNVPVQGTGYEDIVRAGLQPAWTALGITAADIGTLQ